MKIEAVLFSEMSVNCSDYTALASRRRYSTNLHNLELLCFSRVKFACCWHLSLRGRHNEKYMVTLHRPPVWRYTVYTDGKGTSGSSFIYMTELISWIHGVLSWERHEIFIDLPVRTDTPPNCSRIWTIFVIIFLRQMYCNFTLICLSNHQYIL